jgi:hypothetical protein
MVVNDRVQPLFQCYSRSHFSLTNNSQSNISHSPKRQRRNDMIARRGATLHYPNLFTLDDAFGSKPAAAGRHRKAWGVSPEAWSRTDPEPAPSGRQPSRHTYRSSESIQLAIVEQIIWQEKVSVRVHRCFSCEGCHPLGAGFEI